jgi:hypothetical protein
MRGVGGDVWLARKGIAGFLIGNTAETVLRELRRTVFAVKPRRDSQCRNTPGKLPRSEHRAHCSRRSKQCRSPPANRPQLCSPKRIRGRLAERGTRLPLTPSPLASERHARPDPRGGAPAPHTRRPESAPRGSTDESASRPPHLTFPSSYSDQVTANRRESPQDYIRDVAERIRESGIRASGVAVIGNSVPKR